jgi:hypothetical protein
MSYRFQIEVEREAEGGWIAEIPRLPVVRVYGKTKHEAVRSVRALALRVLAPPLIANLFLERQLRKSKSQKPHPRTDREDGAPGAQFPKSLLSKTWRSCGICPI